MPTTTTAKSTTARKGVKPVMDLPADLSPAVSAIERAYRMFQRKFKDAPDVTIVVKRDERAWGHTTVAKTWAPAAKMDAPADRFEIMISGENLRRGAEQVAATLLHEAAHARNLAKGILDTDSNGRHNVKFKETAEDHGLCIEMAGWHGWTKTSWTEDGLKTWKSLVKVIDTGLKKAAAVAPASLDHMGKPIVLPPVPPVVGPDGDPRPGGFAPVAPPKRGNRNLLKAICPCGHAIRVSQGVLDAAAPTCSACSEPFKSIGR
jgi:hypothetical protein